jgi:trimeric autotransporter adhesin
MSGGKGNDTYIVDHTLDTVDETGGNGNDTVQSSVSFTIAAGIETLLLTGSAAINGFGNAGDNAITGNSGNNRLAGEDGADTLTGAAGNDSLDGGNGADLLDGGAGNDTITGGANTTYIVDNVKDVVHGGGTDSLVKSSVSYSLLVTNNTIENLQLTGSVAINGTGNAVDNHIVGNAAANFLDGGSFDDTLEGNGGNDTLDGGLGDDDLIGGDGNDTYVVNSSVDQVSETNSDVKSGGIDLVKGSVSIFALGANIENLTLTGSAVIDGHGNILANVITGNDVANDLFGDVGRDTLIGGGGNDALLGGDGADSMAGGKGDDDYFVDSLGEKITEKNGEGTDTVNASVTFSLGAYLEHLDLTGTDGIGGYGNGFNNRIRGNSGNNILDGNAGADTMEGGDGNDTYYVRELTDVVAENGLTDTDDEVVYMVALGLIANVEHYTFKVTTAVNFAGTDVHNRITGGSGADTLAGGLGSDTLDGSGGNDLLVGGAGNDVYVVGAAGDKVDESGGDLSDFDEVRSAVTFNLTANGTTVLGDIENLILTGTAAINGTGNDFANEITGNDAANKLFGLGNDDSLVGNAGNDTLDGGTGDDTMAGGVGNDTYIVGSDADFVGEAGASGIDTVLSSASGFDLSVDSDGDVENLTLVAGTGNISGFGNGLANVLTGNEGDNTMTDVGGSDTLNGGAGNDTLTAGEGADKLDGGLDDDLLTGGVGNDTIIVSSGNDTVSYTSALDGHDVVTGFDGNATGDQDRLDLDALFDALGVVDGDRAGRVEITDKGSTVEIRVDTTDDSTANFDLFAATLNTADAVTVGEDVLIGTL